MKKSILKAISVLIVVVMAFSLFYTGGSSIVRAASEFKLKDKSDTLTLDYVINKSDGEKQIYPGTGTPTITYGDTLYVSLSWSFADSTILNVGDVLTYTLPSAIKFRDIESEITNDAGKVLGTFTLENNVIKIKYTDPQFCKQNKRKGSLTFSGSIKDNGQGGKPEQDIRLEFPDLVTLTVHMIPPKTSSDVAIKKQIWHVSSQDVPQDTPDKYKNYIYRSRIRITSNGINSNVQFNDEMWPGMTLYSDPVFYSDLELTTEIDSSTFNLKYKKGQNTISAVIPSMSSDEQMWVSYLVLVDPAMFNMETAKEFLKTADPDNKYYYEGFKGKVSNKATAKSDEAPKEVRSWGDVGTIGGSIDKWSCPEDHQFSKGLMHWEIVIKSIIDTDYETGYIIDKLPKNMSLVEENTFIRDTATYNIFKNGIDIKQTKNDDGTTDVKFEFSEEVMKFLKKKETSQAVITYDTKIERQEESEKRYENVATIYYNGDELMEVSAADTFKKPKDLSKVGPYERDKAPFIEFTVTANPAALDLDPNADELTLEDQLCDYYDLDVDSVKVNGKKPGSDIFTYSSSSRKFTLKLQDGVAYTITYRARVNLKKGEWLSGSNSATLYSDSTTGYKQSAKTEVESEVFQSAASSSSENETGVLNIVKHEKGNDSKLLEGAKFSLTAMDGISTVKKLSEDDKGVIETTGANGVAAYGDLERGVVYMLKEVEAPAQYKIDDTIRFYAFTDTKFSFGSTVTYEGTEYPLTVVPLERASYDVYMENEKIPEKSEGSIKITKTISGTVDDADRDSISFVVNDGTTDVWTGTLGTKFTPNSDGVYEAVIDKLDTGKTYSVTESMKDIDGTTLSVSYEINGGSTVEGKSATGVTVEKDKTTTVSFHNVFTKIIKKGSLKFIKTITGLDDNSLADGITFKIAKESEPGSPIATFTYADIKADGYKQIDDLDLGTYTVTESSTNITDYEFKNTSAQMTSSVEVKAENTADAPAELSLSNVYEKEEKPEEPIEEPVVEPVEVTISKVDITDGPEIEGAELVITKDTEDGQVIESWTSGKVSGETGPHKVKLSEGTYVLKETLVPDDFHLQAESITFTVGADGTVTVAGNVSDEKKVVMVDAPAGALRIVIEEEETGDKVPNAVVTVTTMKPDGTTETKEYTTDEAGSIYIPNLPVGNEYSYKVTKVPDGYVVSTAGEETGVEIKAKEVTEKLDKIKKEQKPTEEKTTEATTTEEQTTATTEEQVTTEATTESTTSKPTTETTEDPDDEDPDDEDPDDDSDEDKGTLVITILDEKTRTPIPNAVVTVERPDGTTGTYTTDENGQIIIRDVPTGDYKVTVTQVPPGYTVTTGVSQVVTVEKDKTTSLTALVTDDTQATTQTTQTPGGSDPSNNTTQRTSVRTGDEAKVVLVMLLMSISVIYIFGWCILRYRRRKGNK